MKGKYYYANLLENQNITAKTNLVWTADITSVELEENKRLYVFLCVDIHTNAIVAYTTSTRVMRTDLIVKSLEKAIEKRFPIVPERKLIIHTDRGTQFSSKKYYQFTKAYEDIFLPSMSRENTPTDNSVAERFMRTFKEHEIDGNNIQEMIINEMILNSKVKSYRSIVRKYVDSLNRRPNKKSNKKAPEGHDLDVSTASRLMTEPTYSKAFSEHFGKDLRTNDIQTFKSQNIEVISILREIAARKAEVVDKTPFDNFDDNLVLKIIDERISAIYALIERNPQLTKEYVEEALESVEDSLEKLHFKINQLLPKIKKDREVQPLRDPLDASLFPFFITNAGMNYVYKKDLKQAQLRIAYTILYYTGLRVNEIRMLTENDINDAIKSSQFNVIHFKTKKAHIHVLSPAAVQNLKKRSLDCKVVFDQYKYKYLFGKDKPIDGKTLIRMINHDLRSTCETFDLPYNIKSHSFRINHISSLLKITTIQNTAEIIGHQDIRSTMMYKRYALSKKEIEELLQKITNNEDFNS